MKALLFPGQGVQRVGMLDKLFADVPEIKNDIESLSKSLDFDLECQLLKEFRWFPEHFSFFQKRRVGPTLISRFSVL